MNLQFLIESQLIILYSVCMVYINFISDNGQGTAINSRDSWMINLIL